MKTLTFALLGTLIAGLSSAQASQLQEADIRSDIIGRTIYLAAPLGGEFPLNYKTSGVVNGDGKAVGLGKFIQPTDSGRWWIQADKLCQQFKVWYNGSKMCFELTRTGADSVKWVRDNGDTGMARIGN
ncbi:hypothetical protein [Pararhizobium antarcticum]|uniref:Uncharacterized protein n=1 Tax=Pararhizobium antarcticum TaxID=1798805 RepID=A0A657LZD1_9HYPH|nr:hypothetical protein [Pararhizobium antarcticum]OJF97265.1 hypothetical protein AX761_15270 [Rhizobium sp. 58]OJF99063.1 hypothetical protein AX760_13870 [Pararhizobium antarcticum]